jgi:hypothetical protein
MAKRVYVKSASVTDAGLADKRPNFQSPQAIFRRR